MRTHDIVIGDLGREASIKLVHYCSIFERRIVLNNLRGSEGFRDEQRLWSFDLLCDVGELKALNSSKEYRAAPDIKTLAGYGFDVSWLAKNICSIARSRANFTRKLGRVLRVVIPCNTIAGHIPTTISVESADCANLQVEVLTPPKAVLNHLRSKEIPKVFMPLGTEDAVSAYVNASAEVSRVEIIQPSTSLVNMFKELILLYIEDCVDHALETEINQLAQRELGKARLEKREGFILSACTDVENDHWVSSNRMLAKWMLSSIYSSEGEVHFEDGS